MRSVDHHKFAERGYVHLPAAASEDVADDLRSRLWSAMGLSPHDPAGWTRPVVWATDLEDGPGATIMSSRSLRAALDTLLGVDTWQPRRDVGTIPVRFPVFPADDDRGWHIDQNTLGPDGQPATSGRPWTVLLLVLLSTVGEDDAPTRIRVGSHRDTARVLDAEPLDSATASRRLAPASTHRPVVTATGRPGDMYLCHPFLAHAAQEHHGAEPRFMAQTPILLHEPLTPAGSSVMARSVW
ncbi:phytanoyl-CoA dioxygenase family protein [Spiractinospora alimapuensis]|uniref:phytanoyl-CoA dioxygenase family protein n=1 Tax=Spiractinospora alimapuensis TaxID=2820884 RepID=UPI001F31737B|nr:phytanoyl-CoA dioxygenase family protein [Spiractinospora alimapuensis]QVQ52633.1 phytanoyl-CoA dioxygenase family protein [Spiractinospora alimapuensis]